MELDEKKLKEAVSQLNQLLEQGGLPLLDVVRPEDCIPQEVNARFMDQQMLERLADNVSRDGRLESTPLVCPAEKAGKYEIISGHHRIEGAVKANIKWIIVMVVTVADMDELRAKQLSHNAIEGEDDDVVLKKMYEGLSTLQAKLYAGLQDRLEPVSVVSLSFRAGTFEAFTVAFLPGDVEDYDKAVEVVKELNVSSSGIVRAGEMDSFDLFCKAIRDVKKVENIKSNATALSTLIRMGVERLKEVKQQKKDEQAKEAEPKEAPQKKAARKKAAPKKKVEASK